MTVAYKAQGRSETEVRIRGATFAATLVILLALGPYSVQLLTGDLDLASTPGFLVIVLWAAISAAMVGGLMAPSALQPQDLVLRGIAAGMAFALLFVIGGLAIAQVLAWFDVLSPTEVAYLAFFAVPSSGLAFICGTPLTCLAVWWLRWSYRSARVPTAFDVLRLVAAGLVAFVAVDLVIKWLGLPA
jgi:hypothetical protein